MDGKSLATPEQPPSTPLVRVTEATFRRQVWAAPMPVIVFFGAPECPASRALRPLLEELASNHAGQMRIATVNAAHAELLAEDIGVVATPTLIVVQYGEIITRVVGFLPPGLLRLLGQQVATGTLPPEYYWSPNEATFEEAVVLPLLAAWGLTAVRQAPCRPRGRIDILVYDHAPEEPLTLFENKRRIADALALRQAVAQAHRYAQALRLRSFVVAAPAGWWIYSCAGTRVVPFRQLTSLELYQRPASVLPLLRQLQ